MHETFEGSAELTGYGAVLHETYPIHCCRVDDATGERVDFEISEAIEIPGPLDSTMYKQDIKLHVAADPSRVQELAMETVLAHTDTVSFVTDRRISVSLGLLRKVSSESEIEERTMLFVRRFKGPQELVPIDVQCLAHIAEQIGDADGDRGRHIVRALRWLRRAYLADDEVEEFATMMMGYDGLKSLLPLPPPEGGAKKKGRGKKKVSTPGINAILKHWAVRKCGIAPQNWKQVWDLRNDLFHGDLTENSDTRSKLASAIPNLRLALGLALKHVLNLPEEAPPHLGLPLGVIVDMKITAPPFTPGSGSSPQTPRDGDTSPA